MRKLKKAALLAMLLILAILLSGCIKMHIDVIWNEDNSGTIDMTVGVMSSALSMMGMTDSDIREQFRGSLEGEEADYRFRDYGDSQYVGVVASLDVDNITEDGTEATGELDFICVEDGGKRTYTVSGGFDTSEILGGMGDMEGMGISPDDMDLRISIVMPGRIVTHNATSREGNRLIWDLTDSSVKTVEAASESSGGGAVGIMRILLWALFILSLLVLVAVVVVIVIRVSSKKSLIA